MNPSTFTYHRASSLDDAVSLLQRHGMDAKLLAGGHSLLPVMKLRLAEPAHLIDIADLAALRGVSELPGGGIRIGALTTHHQLERDPLVLRHAPLLAEASAQVGDRQVRSRGTLGGALAHADSAADQPAVVLALDATMRAHGPNGERAIPAGEFFVDFLTTALAPDEVLTAVDIPAMPARSGGSYQKLANQASGYAVVGVAAVVALDQAGTCADARIAVTGALASPRLADAAMRALAGKALDAGSIASASAVADEGLDVLGDLHASEAYRRRVLRGLVRRAVEAAAAQAKARS